MQQVFSAILSLLPLSAILYLYHALKFPLSLVFQLYTVMAVTVLFVNPHARTDSLVQTFCFLGRHSMNLYLLHVFGVYAQRIGPPVVSPFFSLRGFTLLRFIVLEYAKQYFGVYTHICSLCNAESSSQVLSLIRGAKRRLEEERAGW